MEEHNKYVADLKGIINENELKLSNYEDENKCLKVSTTMNVLYTLI